MLITRISILFSLPSNLKWKDAFLVNKRVKQEFAKMKSFCPTIFLSWDKRLIKSRCTSHRALSPWAHYGLHSRLWHCAVTDSGKYLKETLYRIHGLGSKSSLKSTKGVTSFTFSKSDIVRKRLPLAVKSSFVQVFLHLTGIYYALSFTVSWFVDSWNNRESI